MTARATTEAEERTFRNEAGWHEQAHRQPAPGSELRSVLRGQGTIRRFTAAHVHRSSPIAAGTGPPAGRQCERPA